MDTLSVTFLDIHNKVLYSKFERVEKILDGPFFFYYTFLYNLVITLLL